MKRRSQPRRVGSAALSAVRVPERWQGDNVYGHTKRLQFVLHELERYRAETGARREDLSVLEIGCGTGMMVAYPLEQMGWRVIGVDTDEPSIEAGREWTHGLVDLRVGLAQEVVDRRSVDVAVCSEVMEHLEDPTVLASACNELVKPGGALLVTVPNGYGWFEFEQAAWSLLHVDSLLSAGRWVRTMGKRVRQKLSKELLGRAPVPDPEPDPDQAPLRFLPSTLSSSPHVQRFTVASISRVLRDGGWTPESCAGSTLFSGKFTNAIAGRSQALIRADLRLGDRVPLGMASGWYFACRRANDVEAAVRQDAGARRPAGVREAGTGGVEAGNT